MGMTDKNLCVSCINLGCEFQSGIVRTECAFYMPPYIEPDNCGNYVVQVPTTKNDLGVDFIDRTELLKAMDTWDKFGYSARYGLERLDKDDKGFVPYVKYDDMVDCVKGMPSVTPQEPRKGHWKVVSDGYGDNAYICECSECKDTVWVYKDADRKWNYCPNCGADMREAEE